MFFIRKRYGKNRNVFELISKHLELSEKAAEKVMNEFVIKHERHSIESIATEVDILEKHGDELIAEIVKTISQSAIPITMYGDFSIFTDIIDDILDELYFIAQEVNRGRKAGLDTNPIVLEIYSDLASMTSVAKMAITKLKELVIISLKDIKKAENLSHEVDMLEDRVDELRNTVIDKIYSPRKKLDPLALYHLIELAKAIDRFVDACKDASHVLMSIVTAVIR